jgi:hypothetical protein
MRCGARPATSEDDTRLAAHRAAPAPPTPAIPDVSPAHVTLCTSFFTRPALSSGNEEKFREVTEAYEILFDKEKRVLYDHGGCTATPPPASPPPLPLPPPPPPPPSRASSAPPPSYTAKTAAIGAPRTSAARCPRPRPPAPACSRSGRDRRYATLCYAMLWYAMVCYAMVCYAMLCCVMLCCAVLCCAVLC